jgi:O-antigen/teichoic acid export membrane protein
MTSNAVSGRRLRSIEILWRRGLARSIARTAGFNVASAGAAGLGGIILARALGPTARGEYAAVTSWFGVALVVGGMGQPAALCYFVAKQPQRAREYVATSRAMMLMTGTVALSAGMLLAPLLAHGNAAVTLGYRIAFGASIIAFIGASYTFSLQAWDLHRWNVVRVSQPVFSMIITVVLWRLRLLTLDVALIVITVTMALQLLWAYVSCRRVDLAPGRASADLIRPLLVYGMAQIAALTPAVLNADLDQLILSQTVPAADLGRYAIAVTLTQLPIPVVSAIGNVAFPRLASQRGTTAATLRLQRKAILGSAGLAVVMLVPLAVLAPWFVPLVFGAAYRGVVPLVWLLTPGTVFLACGQVVGDLLRGRSHPSTVAWAQGFAAIFTVVLLLALLPVVGVPGAAIASTVAYGVAFFAMLRRLVRLPRHARGSGPREATGEPNGLKATHSRVSK